MFERFTDRARRVLVLAQEEARLLNHSFIGTEHLLLGLIRESDGVAAVALGELDISLTDVRDRVEQTIGQSGTPPSGSPPFTPRAKKVLELSLREALQLGHNYIGTEHILLGLVREGEGVAAQVLVSLGADLSRVRQAVIRLLGVGEAGSSGEGSGYGDDTTAPLPMSRGLQLRRGGALVECSFCGRQPPHSGRLISGRRGVYVCEHCVKKWGERLAGSDDDTAVDPDGAEEAVVLTGRTPVDEEAARMEISLAFGHALVLSEDRRTVPSVEGGESLGPCLKEAQERHAGLRRSDGTVRIDDIEFLDEDHASVVFALALEGLMSEPRRGEALVVDAVWKMSRTTFCELMTLAGVQCPPL